MDEKEFWDQTIQKAVYEGTRRIIDRHPLWKTNPNYITSQINMNSMNDAIKRIHQDLSEKDYDITSLDEFQEHFINHIADYISSGDLLTDDGKELILNQSLEDRAKNSSWFSGGKAIAEYDGDRKFEETADAFTQLYLLMKPGNYRERMPELADALERIEEAKFLKPALDTLKNKGLIDDNRYQFIKEALEGSVKKEGEKITKYIETRAVGSEQTQTTDITKYSASNYEGQKESQYAGKVAASILGLLGLGILVSTQTSLTGGAIGTAPTNSIGMYGIAALLISMIMWMFILRKK